MCGVFRVSTCLSHDIKEPTAIRQEVRLSAQQVNTVWITGGHIIKQPTAAHLRALWQCSPVVLKRVIRDFISDHTQQKLTLFLTTGNVNLETERKKNVAENIFIKYSVQITPQRKDLLRKLILPHNVKIFTAFYGSQKFIIVFITTHHLPLAWTRLIQSNPFYSLSLRSTPISSKCSLSLSLPIINIYEPLFSPHVPHLEIILKKQKPTELIKFRWRRWGRGGAEDKIISLSIKLDNLLILLQYNSDKML
jgi:hypothetical protein